MYCSVWVLGFKWKLYFTLTLVSPSGASGSVIQDPNREPDVLMVIASLMPVSFPHAAEQTNTQMK